MVSFMNRTLGAERYKVAASAKADGCDGQKDEDETNCNGKEDWWSQLCANKYLTEDENFKRVRGACGIAHGWSCSFVLLSVCLLPLLSWNQLPHHPTNETRVNWIPPVVGG